jgi:arsenate reductase (thioredoxin)
MKRVLFMCLGNICRSPMAEALARKYGSDVLEVSSAGLTPAINTTPYTRKVLEEKNVDLGDHVPRRFYDLDLSQYDLIVNMSGSMLPKNLGVPVEDWQVDDPMGRSEDDFRAAREVIEMLVMRLILRVRLGKL